MFSQVFHDQMNFVTDGTPGSTLEVVVIRGCVWAPWEQAMLDSHARQIVEMDVQWEEKIIAQLHAMSSSAGFRLTVTRPARCLEMGCVLVDKGTGRVTILVKRGHFGRSCVRAIVGTSDPPTEAETLLRREIDNFYVLLSSTEYHKDHLTNCTLYSSFLVYDLTEDVALPQLSSVSRELVRWRKIHGDLPENGNEVRGVFPLKAYTMELRGALIHMDLVNFGHFCDTCRKPTKFYCPRCKGAWYCSAEHQNQSWATHKPWCKSHRQE